MNQTGLVPPRHAGIPGASTEDPDSSLPARPRGGNDASAASDRLSGITCTLELLLTSLVCARQLKVSRDPPLPEQAPLLPADALSRGEPRSLDPLHREVTDVLMLPRQDCGSQGVTLCGAVGGDRGSANHFDGGEPFPYVARTVSLPC